MSAERTISDGGVRLREAQGQVAHLELTLVQVRGEAQALRAEMETQRNRATQLEQLFQQQVINDLTSASIVITDCHHSRLAWGLP